MPCRISVSMGSKGHFFDLTSKARGVCPPHDEPTIQSKCTVRHCPRHSMILSCHPVASSCQKFCDSPSYDSMIPGAGTDLFVWPGSWPGSVTISMATVATAALHRTS